MLSNLKLIMVSHIIPPEDLIAHSFDVKERGQKSTVVITVATIVDIKFITGMKLWDCSGGFVSPVSLLLPL